ncbi:hypothetical protein C8R43DRAFT_947319 [Mycena crocata]|nr:hypothetical protein C8R43DRAFT_947319 [Mycena crocata]
MTSTQNNSFPRRDDWVVMRENVAASRIAGRSDIGRKGQAAAYVYRLPGSGAAQLFGRKRRARRRKWFLREERCPCVGEYRSCEAVIRGDAVKSTINPNGSVGEKNDTESSGKYDVYSSGEENDGLRSGPKSSGEQYGDKNNEYSSDSSASSSLAAPMAAAVSDPSERASFPEDGDSGDPVEDSNFEEPMDHGSLGKLMPCSRRRADDERVSLECPRFAELRHTRTASVTFSVTRPTRPRLDQKLNQG